MSSEAIKFELTADSVRSIVDANVKAAVLSAMQSQGPQLIKNLVNNVLTAKINRNYRDTTFMDSVIFDFLEAETKAALKDYLTENQPLIRGQIERAIKDSKTGFAKMIAEGLAKASENAYRVEVNIKTNRD